MSGQYILNEKNEAIPCEDILEWGRWMQKADRHVALDETPNGKVSTVFLGLDHCFMPGGPPLLFETMVFGGSLDGEQQRYGTSNDALKGHAAMLARVNLKRSTK